MIAKTVKRIYGILPNRIHHSDLKFCSLLPTKILPPSVDLRKNCPAVYDQGQLGSCTGQALAAIYAFKSNNTVDPSRLFIYYNERVLEHDVSQDNGALISDGIKTLQRYGVCPESDWPYDITKFALKPNAKCYSDALKHKAISVTNVPQDVTSMKTCLAA